MQRLFISHAILFPAQKSGRSRESLTAFYTQGIVQREVGGRCAGRHHPAIHRPATPHIAPSPIIAKRQPAAQLPASCPTSRGRCASAGLRRVKVFHTRESASATTRKMLRKVMSRPSSASVLMVALPRRRVQTPGRAGCRARSQQRLSLIHISEPTRPY